jgi:hypothetical protein
MKRIAALTAAAFLAVGLAGCGEREQTARYEDGRYRGKLDTRPWDNAPPPYGSAPWAKGDHASWENQVRSRQQTQNENRRIGH